MASFTAASCTLDAAGTAPTPPGGGGSGGSGSEVCLDGIDNDGDGDIDCADSDCDAGYECVDVPESGWTGYTRVQQVAYPGGSPQEACPDGSAPAVYYAGETGAAECAACDCTFTGATCTAPELRCYLGTSSCTGTPSITAQAADTACVSSPPGSMSNTGSCVLGMAAVVHDAGTCTTDGGENTNPSPWQTEVRVCASVTGGGCGAGKACAPRSPPSFDAAVCMSKAGMDSCPGGWTAVDLQAYRDFTDTRACMPCRCDTDSITCSGGYYTIYDDNTCLYISPTPLDISSSCVNASGYVDNGTFSYTPHLGTPSEGMCMESAATGSLDKRGATRICCK